MRSAISYTQIATTCFMFFLTIFAIAEDKICFLHIPKTGGLTFRAFLRDHYESNQTAKVTNGIGWEQQVNLSNLQDKNLRLISGHTVYAHLKDYVADFTKVTFLRNPVERILSEHHYILDREHKDKSKVLKMHFLPENGDPIDTASNVVCRLLSKLDPLDPAISIEKHLESAKEALMHDFDFVGITERMEESVTLFCYLLGWKVPENLAFHNATSRKNSYPQSLLDKIAERNWADMELYQLANELFEMKKQQIVPWLKEENIQYLDQIDYNFTAPLDGFGWCPREERPEGIFRWLCSPERGCIDFPLMTGHDYILRMELYIPISLLKKLSIYMNGTALSYSIKGITFGGEYQWVVCQAKIPQSLIKPAKKSRLEIAIQDPSRIPSRDSYRGRCGARKISIATH